MVNGMPFGTPTSPLFSAIGSDPSDRILVLLQLSGGNDGLATLVPIDQFDNLAHVRSNIIIPENQLTPLTDTLSLHPSIDNFRSVWDQGNLSIIQDVAYPNQDRSHFRSMDIWQSGSPADEIWDTGWVGRHLDQYHPTYPTGYPNIDHPDPIAVSLGYSISETCQGVSGNFGLSVSNPYNLSDIFENGNQPPPAGKYGDELDYLRTTIAQSNAYGAVVKAAVEAGTSSRTYPTSYLGYQMQNIVKLITGGLRSKVYVLSVGGFDTHAGQVDPSDTRTGEHANLLSIINEALPVFLNDLADQGLSSVRVSNLELSARILRLVGMQNR